MCKKCSAPDFTLKAPLKVEKSKKKSSEGFQGKFEKADYGQYLKKPPMDTFAQMGLFDPLYM